MRADLMRASKLPRAPPDVRENNNNPTQMWGRSPLCCMNRPPQLSIHPPSLMHAIFFALAWQEGGCAPEVAAQTTTQMPKYSCHCIHALIASMPAFSGQAHGSTYNPGAKMGKRLHSDTDGAHGEIRKGRLILVLNTVRWCQMLDIQPCTVVIQAFEADDAAQYPEDLWILKDSVAHHHLPMPTFSDSSEHGVPSLWPCRAWACGGRAERWSSRAIRNQSLMWALLSL